MTQEVYILHENVHFKNKIKKKKSKLNRFIAWIETPLFPCHPIKCTIRQNPGPRAPFRHTHPITTRNQNGGFGKKNTSLTICDYCRPLMARLASRRKIEIAF